MAGETPPGLAKRHDICRNPIRVWITSAHNSSRPPAHGQIPQP